MERFIIGSPAYRNYYAQFMNYLHAVGYSLSSRKTFTTGIKEFLWWLEKQKIITIHTVEESDIETFYTYLQERPSLIGGGALSESRITLHMYTLKRTCRMLITYKSTRSEILTIKKNTSARAKIY